MVIRYGYQKDKKGPDLEGDSNVSDYRGGFQGSGMFLFLPNVLLRCLCYINQGASIMNNDYNGWTNYETWRVNLEMFDGLHIDNQEDNPHGVHELAEYLKETAIQAIEDGCTHSGGFALDYALAFLDAVDFRQIAIRKLEEVTA